ncbi:MAG: hypothetical protein MK116_07215 [Phycisphaerales bacterium]|nr:hypothetical protein [Phycisphaerales bacterium]
MKPSMTTRGFSALLATLVLSTSTVVMSAAAQAEVQEAYVYNGDYFKFTGVYGANGGNEIAHAMVFKNLGMLDANGRLPQVDLTVDNYIRQGDVIVGRVIHCNTESGHLDACIYETLDGTKRAYDLSNSATLRQAWNEVAADGEITILKHGLETQFSDETSLYGGALALDDGEFYAGFRNEGDTADTGTGLGVQAGPYELPPRPGAAITIKLMVCHGDMDFDGFGSGTSVVDSAKNIGGVTAVSGAAHEIYVGCTVQFPGATEAQKKAARRMVGKLAVERGFVTKDGRPDPGALFRSGTLKVRTNILDDIESTLGVTGKLTWYDTEDVSAAPHCELVDGPASDFFSSGNVQGCQAVDVDGGIIHRDVDGPGQDESLTSTLIVYPGSAPGPRPIEIVETQLDEMIVPDGLAPVCAPVTVRKYGVDPVLDLNWEAEFFFEYPQVGPEPIGLYRLEADGTLVPDDFGWYDPWAFVGGTMVREGGTYVLLGEAVEPRTADFNLDRRVDIDDLLELFDAWGDCQLSWCQHDLDNDERIAVDDLLVVLSQWGSDF